jgi:hypothetical protein
MAAFVGNDERRLVERLREIPTSFALIGEATTAAQINPRNRDRCAH